MQGQGATPGPQGPGWCPSGPAGACVPRGEAGRQAGETVQRPHPGQSGAGRDRPLAPCSKHLLRSHRPGRGATAPAHAGSGPRQQEAARLLLGRTTESSSPEQVTGKLEFTLRQEAGTEASEAGCNPPPALNPVSAMHGPGAAVPHAGGKATAPPCGWRCPGASPSARLYEGLSRPLVLLSP